MFTGSPSWDAALIWCPCGKIPEIKGERSGLAHRFRGFSILSQPCCLWAWLKDRVSRQGKQPTVMPFTWWTGSRQKESGLGFWYTLQSTPQLPSFFHNFPSSHSFWIVPLHWLAAKPWMRENSGGSQVQTINKHHGMVVGTGGNSRTHAKL